MKRKLTQQDLTDNPELKEQGLTEGDEIDIPEPEEIEKEETENKANTNAEPANDDTGGSAPPPNKERGS